jgi:hypothetical protein
MSLARSRLPIVALAAFLCCFLFDALARAQDKPQGEKPPGDLKPKIIIGGGFGGGGALPEAFAEMIKATQEIQELQQKYQTSLTDLIAEAKKLDDPQTLMQTATKVAKMARESEKLKLEIDKKQQEITKKLGRGIISVDGVGGFGIGDGGASIKILPAPDLKRVEEKKVDGPAKD